MVKYKSKYITVVKVLRETHTTSILFTDDRRVMIINDDIESYFLEHYKHLGITPNNVIDFIKGDDPKYKLELEDMEKFLDYYLYDEVCAQKLEKSLEN